MGCQESSNILLGGCASKNKVTRSGPIHENNVRVHGVVTEMKIIILAYAKPHLVEYIALEIVAMDDERLQNDLDAY